jgi:hypothetical protein
VLSEISTRILGKTPPPIIFNIKTSPISESGGEGFLLAWTA